MIEADSKALPLIVSEDFLAKIRRTEDNIPSGASSNGLPNFSIRYSVPTAPLKQSNNDLQLRKTTRGEYVVEEPAATSAPTVGTEQDEGSQTSSNGSMTASFRGPGNVAYDAECVLIYNEEAQKYELHLLEMNIQVAPVLKGRLRNSTNSSSAGSAGAGSASASSSSSQNQVNGNAVRDRKPQDIKAHARGSQKGLSGGVSKSLPTSPTKRSTSPAKRSPASQATNGSAQAAKPSATAAPSAAFLPKRSTKAKLPTRRKLAPAKPKLGPLMSKTATPEPSSGAHNIDSPSNSTAHSSTSHSKSSSTSPSSLSTVSSAASSPKKTSESPQPGPQFSPQPVDSGFDDAFEDLADELADELMEDEMQHRSQDSRFVGTAGGSAEDEDVSSEEE